MIKLKLEGIIACGQNIRSIMILMNVTLTLLFLIIWDYKTAIPKIMIHYQFTPGKFPGTYVSWKVPINHSHNSQWAAYVTM
jgi:hypothetical protein